MSGAGAAQAAPAHPLPPPPLPLPRWSERRGSAAAAVLLAHLVEGSGARHSRTVYSLRVAA